MAARKGKKTVCFNLPDAMAAKLAIMAKKHNVSMSMLVEALLVDSIIRNEDSAFKFGFASGL